MRSLACILAALLTVLPGRSEGQTGGGWEARAPLPEPRQEVGVGILGGMIYVIGKFAAVGQEVTPVERYDPAGDTWEAVAPVPTPATLNHVGVAAAGDRLYAIGGLQEGFEAVANVYAYDPANDLWSEVASLPEGRAAMGVATLGGLVFAAGGLPDSRNRRFTVYDPEADIWTSLPDMPTGRDHLAAVALRGRFYAFGGREGAVGKPAAESFDPATGQWSSHVPMPTPRGGIAAAVVAERAYVFGGEGNTEPGSNGVFRDVDEYDPDSDSWRPMADLPDEGRHGAGAAVHRGRIHIPGGAVVQGFGPTDRHDAFTPPGQTLVTFDGTPVFGALNGDFDGIDWGPAGWLTVAGNLGPCAGPRALSPRAGATFGFADPAALISFDVGALAAGGLLLVVAFDEGGNLLEFAAVSLQPGVCVTADTAFARRAAEVRILSQAGAFTLDNVLYAAP